MLIFGKMMFYTAPFAKLPFITNVNANLAAETAMTALNDGRFPDEAIFELLYGKCAGNIGEISALLIILGGIFLISRGIIHILSTQRLQEKRCPDCGRRLAWNWPHRLCDNCFQRQLRRRGHAGDW